MSPGRRPSEYRAEARFQPGGWAALVTLAWPSGTSGSTIAGGQSLRPSIFHGSRSGDFPAPSMALGRCRPGLRGLPALAALPGEIDPHDLRLAFRALATLLEPATSRRTGTGLLLSWSCPLVASPPCSVCASTPEWRPETPLFGPVVPRTDLVPPSWFLTTSTAFSAQGLRVCCTPLPALGFIAFPVTCPRRFRRSRGRENTIPAMWAHTLRRVPLADSRTASLRPLPSCRCRALMLPGPGGLVADTPKGVGEPPEGGCACACAVVTMLRFAWANPHVVSNTASRRAEARGWRGAPVLAAPSSPGIFVAVHPGVGGLWRAAGSKALLHRRVRCRPPPSPVTKRSFLPWALFPFKVLQLPLLPDIRLGNALHTREEWLARRASRERWFVLSVPARHPSVGSPSATA
jgi:hypothetical protein